jgi:hypothetical protein
MESTEEESGRRQLRNDQQKHGGHWSLGFPHEDASRTFDVAVKCGAAEREGRVGLSFLPLRCRGLESCGT